MRWSKATASLGIGLALGTTLGACGSDVTVFGTPGHGGQAGGTTPSTGGTGGGTSTSTSTTTSSSGTAGGGQGGTAGSGGVGGAPGCTGPEDCAVDGVCVEGVCESGQCVIEPWPAGTQCYEGDEHWLCDGEGLCLLANGGPCTGAEECFSAQCVDGVCCDGGCQGSCEACDVLGSEGTCQPIDPGIDPDGECGGGVCDGGGSCVSGAHLWSGSFGESFTQIARSVAVDDADNAVVVGYFSSAINFGNLPLTSAGNFDAFAVKLDPGGKPLWSRRFGDGSAQQAWDVAVDPKNNVVLTGYFSGTIDFGCGPLQGKGGDDAFVAKLDPNGACVWSRSFGDGSDQQARSVAVDQSGNVAVGGFFQGNVDFGGGYLLSAGDYDGFVAVYDPGGIHLWSKRYGDAQDQRIYGVAYDGAGNLALVGRHFGTIDLGGPALTSAGQRDVLVAKLDGQGQHLWSKQFGDGDNQLAWNVSADAAGNLVVVGYAFGTIDFGGGPLVSSGQQDAFVAKLDGQGQHLLSKLYGSAQEQELYDAAVDGKGRVVFTGFAQNTIDFGGGPLPSGGAEDAVMAKLTGDGAHLWSKRFGAGGTDVGAGIATDSKDAIWLVGYHSGTIDLGGGSFGANYYDVFIAKFQP